MRNIAFGLLDAIMNALLCEGRLTCKEIVEKLVGFAIDGADLFSNCKNRMGN